MSLTITPSIQANWGQGLNKFKQVFNSISIPTLNLTSNSYWTEDFSNDYKINLLNNICLFRNYTEVYNFLCNHQNLIALLFEAYAEIKANFGQNTSIILDVVTDPDFQDEKKLYVFIKSLLDPDVAYDLLDALDENWWLDAMPKAEDKMNIDLELV